MLSAALPRNVKDCAPILLHKHKHKHKRTILAVVILLHATPGDTTSKLTHLEVYYIHVT
jgi:hypothetical protein